MFNRIIYNSILHWIGKRKTIILYGARQTGKTTLCKKVLSNFIEEGLFLDCEILYNRNALSKPDDIILKALFKDKKIVIIDEAQKVQNIGSVLKVIHDHIPEVQVIATGSSSFDNSKHTNENLTGKAIEFYLYPLSIGEITQKYNILQIPSKLEDIMKYGLYPGVFDSNQEESKENLKSIVNNYLYKDILEFAGVRKSEFIINILQMLALQVGSEVSYTELANKLNLNIVTIQNYIDLLEKSFVIYKIKGFSRNLRNEITKTVKIYFWDIGVMNSLLNNFNTFDLRHDKGGLWENFCITERQKFNKNNRNNVNIYFWRTYNQQEIDYIEEKDGKLYAFEFKLNSNKKVKLPNIFKENYPNSEFKVINMENFLEFII